MNLQARMFRIFVCRKNNMSNLICNQCNAALNKDLIALNKKLLGKKIDKYLCLECLADYLGATTDDLLIKITEFKEQGCDLFK